MITKMSGSTIVGNTQEAVDFITNILESSTEYSIIGKDLDGKILLWNEGARRLYGYEPEEVVGKANSAILHTVEDVTAGKPRRMLDAALSSGHWEGTIARRRKNGQQFMARVVVTPRRDASGAAIGFLLMSKDVSNEVAFSEELRKAKLFDSAIVGNAQEAVDFITNILESSTEYSVVGKDLDGKILLWNEGARRPIEVLIPSRFHGDYGAHRDVYFEDPRVRSMGAGSTFTVALPQAHQEAAQ